MTMEEEEASHPCPQWRRRKVLTPVPNGGGGS